MCVCLTLLNDRFLTTTNLLDIGRQVSLLGIMAVGMTFVLISGEVDLSVGSTYAFAGLATGMIILLGVPLLPAILAGLICGAVIGLINGVLSTHGRLPSLIAPLGTLSMVRGAALILTDGRPVTVNERNGGDPAVLDQFSFIGQGCLGGVVPMQLVFFVVVAALGWLLLSRTILGVLIIGVLRNGLVLTGVSPFAQEFLIGLVIVVAVAINKWTSQPRGA
ncbi:MAG: ABC transporter permease [Gemmobacter sp.]